MEEKNGAPVLECRREEILSLLEQETNKGGSIDGSYGM